MENENIEQEATETTDLIDGSSIPNEDISNILEMPEKKVEKEEQPKEEPKEEEPKDEEPEVINVKGKQYTPEQIAEFEEAYNTKYDWQKSNQQKQDELAHLYKQFQESQKQEKPEVSEYKFEPTGDPEIDSLKKEFAEVLSQRDKKYSVLEDQLKTVVDRLQYNEDSRTIESYRPKLEESIGRKVSDEEYNKIQDIALSDDVFFHVARSMFMDSNPNKTVKEVNELIKKNKSLNVQGAKGQKVVSSGKLSEAQREQIKKFNEAGIEMSERDYL